MRVGIVSVLAASLSLVAAQKVVAADMPVKAPVLKAPAVIAYDWTGFYVGGNVGVGVGRDFTRDVVTGASFETSYLNPQGKFVGGQIGYNWQISNGLFNGLVLGAEADIQRASIKDDFSCLFGCVAGSTGLFNQKLDWFGTARGRLGIANGPVLTYVTGGWAYGSVRTSVNEDLGAPVPTTVLLNHDRHGWTAGSGLEASLGGNWTGKIEYLYVNLGSRQDSFTVAGFAQTLTTDVREHIFRVGVNYRVGGNGAAYVPTPAGRWTGFYAGGNIGYGVARDQSTATFAFVGFAQERFDLSPAGVNGGFQAGYNWQASNNWVLGVEADIQRSGARDNRACVQTCNPTVFPQLVISFDQSLPWFATARTRFGYSVGPTLYYATAGLAYGKVNTRVNALFLGPPGTSEISDMKSGWTVGGGIESAVTVLPAVLGRNWSWKSEYLYVDLGSSTGSFGVTSTFVGAVINTSTTTQVREHIFRTGLNYHFNSAVLPN